MVSFLASLIESMVRIREEGIEKKGEVAGYGNSGWTMREIGRDRSCLGSDSRIVVCGEPGLRQPRSGGSSPSGLHSSNGFDGDDIIGKMLERNRLRNDQLQRSSAVRT